MYVKKIYHQFQIHSLRLFSVMWHVMMAHLWVYWSLLHFKIGIMTQVRIWLRGGKLYVGGEYVKIAFICLLLKTCNDLFTIQSLFIFGTIKIDRDIKSSLFSKRGWKYISMAYNWLDLNSLIHFLIINTFNPSFRVFSLSFDSIVIFSSIRNRLVLVRLRVW